MKEVYDILFARYKNLNWWPAETPYEVMVGAVLTQNTNWDNVKKAIANFRGAEGQESRLTPEFVETAPLNTLEEIIRPSGFFRQKAVYLKAVTAWYGRYGHSVGNVRKRPLELIRPELCAVRGVGFETADSILLYAFGYPTFVVDAYTKRLFERLGIDIKPDYHNIKSYIEGEIPPDTEVYNNFHAMIVVNAKEHCRKKPKCGGCPLEGRCRT